MCSPEFSLACAVDGPQAEGCGEKAILCLEPAAEIPDKHSAHCVSQWVTRPVFSLCCLLVGLVNVVLFHFPILPSLAAMCKGFGHLHMFLRKDEKVSIHQEMSVSVSRALPVRKCLPVETPSSDIENLL